MLKLRVRHYPVPNTLVRLACWAITRFVRRFWTKDGKSPSCLISAPPTLPVLTSGWVMMTQGKHSCISPIDVIDQTLGTYIVYRSIAKKASFVKALKLGGMAAWTLETDDSRGACGEKYPLLKAINKALRDPSVDEKKENSIHHQ